MEKLKFVSFGSKLHSKLLTNYPDLKKVKKVTKSSSTRNN